MSLPTFQNFLHPVLQAVADRATELKTKDVADDVARKMNLSIEDREIRIRGGTQTAFDNRLYWAFIYLQRAGLLKRIERGVYSPMHDTM